MATTEFNISADHWSEIGTGPMLVETKHQQNAYLHFGDAAPPIATEAYHDLVGPSSFSYGGSTKCFARAMHGNAKLITTEGA